MLKQPRLIQRCELKDGRVYFQYMGSAEFEWGDQSKSLVRIFETGLTSSSCTVTIDDQEVTVYMVAGQNFPFADFQPHLQQLTNDEGKLRLQEPAYFQEKVERLAGIKQEKLGYPHPVDAWFDFRNDVLWTLTQKNQGVLMKIIKNLVQEWNAARASEKTP